MRPTLNIPLTLSQDTRGVASFTNSEAGKDQRRVNCHYLITRTAVDAQPDIAIAKRPGVTGDGNTYGAATQIQYLMARDPASTWDPTAWVLVKDGDISKAVTSSTATTILNNSAYYPRFWDITDVSGTNFLVVQLQNGSSPSGTPAQKVYYSSAIATFTEISDADFTGLSQRGKMEFIDGYAFIMDSRCRIYQSDINSLSAWGSTNYITLSSTNAPAQGIIKCRSQILGFTTDYVETFRNEGNATGSVLSRVTGTEHRIGLASLAGGGTMTGKLGYYVSLGDLVFFLGRYGGSKNDASLVAYDGNRYEKVSRPNEDTLLSNTTVYGLHKWSFGGKVAVYVQLTAPTATTQKGWAFFPDINEGFFVESTVWGPANNGYHYTGATDPQKAYYFGTSDNFQDDGTNYTMTVQFRLPIASLEYKAMSMCGVVADTTGSASNLAVSFSDDDCANFSTARNIDLSKKQKELYRCGVFRERHVKLTSTGNVEARMRRFYASIT